MQISNLIVLLILSFSLNILGGESLTIKLQRISTDFNKPISVEYHAPSNTLITSANYPGGSPYNFYQVHFDGTQNSWSDISGLTEELKLCIVRNNQTGFKAGDIFTGSGNSGEITRITESEEGSEQEFQIIKPWCALGNVGLMRGSLFIDRTGLFDYHLIVATTAGYIFQIDPECSNPKQLHNFGVHLEGLVVVPNIPSKWGRLAGKIIAGAEGQQKMHIVGSDGSIESIDARTSTGSPVAIEDIDIIEAGENFFGVDFQNGRMLGATWEQFVGYEGEIFVVEEFGNNVGAHLLRVDGENIYFETVTYDPSGEQPAQWEHGTFSGSGVREILPPYFSLCIRAETSENIITENMKPLQLTGFSDAQTNYGYSSRKANLNEGKLKPNMINIFFTQDPLNFFTLNIICSDGLTGSAGQVTLVVATKDIGSGVNTLIQDDASSVDERDTYTWNSNTGGRFTWTWGAGQTDGVVLGPLDLVTSTKRFEYEIRVTGSSQGLTHFNLISQIGSSFEEHEISITETVTISRFSCTCGNGVIDRWEQCDGGLCCGDCMFRRSSFNCRPKSGLCDTDDYCTGNSASCTDTVSPAGITCRSSQGVCDVRETCDGVSGQCPADSKKDDLCRAAAGPCDLAESCDGINNGCPTDQKKVDGTTCDDGNECSSESVCFQGVCSGSDNLCGGTCGDGVLDEGEECDLGSATDTLEECCLNCRFVSNIVCRNSTGICDPEETCSGNSGSCPADVNNRCPECPGNCSSNGACVSDDVCECNAGYAGDNCEIPLCSELKSCGNCSTNPDCDWCCESQLCLPKSTGNTTCQTFVEGKCDCDSTCQNDATCACGKCDCLPGNGGEDCSKIVGCDGVLRDPSETLPVEDVCNVCRGNGTTCLGCDGLPFGKKYDVCGVCGGDGSSCYDPCDMSNCRQCSISETCSWCSSSSECVSSSSGKAKSCEELISDSGDCGFIIPVEAAAGIGAGLIVGIIGAVVAAFLISVGGKKGYDVWVKNHDNFSGSQNNPLYDDAGKTGVNPLYDNRA